MGIVKQGALTEEDAEIAGTTEIDFAAQGDWKKIDNGEPDSNLATALFFYQREGVTRESPLNLRGLVDTTSIAKLRNFPELPIPEAGVDIRAGVNLK